MRFVSISCSMTWESIMWVTLREVASDVPWYRSPTYVGERYLTIPCLSPRKEVPSLTILDIINTLDALALNLVSPSMGDLIANRVKSCKPPNVGVWVPWDCMGSLVSAFHHDFPGFIVMSPHPRPREILKLFDGTPIQSYSPPPTQKKWHRFQLP